ncbi:hypothetical protein [Actinocorallia sp. A-T 12471]|uniref:hypothetical protein n=1 Tax=Actinocorallia sp. A-T 12471 TaxID=3089813 RepID=UPI0029CFEEB0|nr:hypothetical protein [Actinocorallia sp. A-T 12471]MDX6741620.1 hypothetical protein [Actinocorallia sp. A-T 12471]
MEYSDLAQAAQAIMKERGWTQAQLGEALGRTPSWASLVASGKNDVGFSRLAKMLGRVGYELVIRRKPDEAEVKRRAFLASAATVALVPSANGNPYRDPEYVQALSQRIGANLYGSGGLTAVEEAAKHLRRVKLTAADVKDTRFLSAASSLARHVSLVEYDARRLPQAKEAGKLAVVFARAADDHTGQIGALNELSMFGAYEGDGLNSHLYARQALTIPDVTPEEEAAAHVNFGRSLGLLNEKRNSALHLDRAREIGEGLDHFQRLNLIGNVGVALHDQAAWEPAQNAFQEAVNGLAPSSPWLAANLMARQVQGALKASQPLLAADLMESLGRLAPLVSSARLDTYLHEIGTLSAPWKHTPEVKTMRDQLKVLLL